jgi:ribosomal protein S18 acetylase RimI-like enzyme
MEISLREINAHNLQDAGKCDSSFMVDTLLVLSAENNVVHFNTVSISPYKKKYPVEKIDYGLYLSRPDRTVFLAYCDQSIAGEIRLRRNWNIYAYIEEIVVDVNFRRHGIGRQLIQTAIQWAKNRNLPGVMLESQNNNVAACRLYQSCGFELGGFDRYLYRGIDSSTQEIALYWYIHFNDG